MRVAQFVNTLKVTDGGPARNSFELNQALNAIEDVTVQLLWFRGDESGTTYSEDRAFGRVMRGPVPMSFGSLSAARKAFRAINSSEIVVIHGFYLWWVPLLGLISRMHQKPLVIMPHGSISPFEKQRSRAAKNFFDLVASICLGRGLRFVAGSESEAADVRAVFPIHPVSVAGVGARLGIENPRIASRAASDELVLLSVSRVSPKKRIDLMIGATAELAAMGVPARLVVAGAGDASYIRSLNDLALSLGVDEWVEFVGLADHQRKAELFSRAHVFLLPSDDENFGIGLAEALSSGLPAVTSDRVAAAHLVTSGGRTMLSSPTPRSLAEAAARYADPEVWQKASAAARRDASRAYSWEAVAARWRTILDSQIKEHVRGRGTS